MTDPKNTHEGFREFVTEATRYAFVVTERAPYTFEIVPSNQLTIDTLDDLAKSCALSGGLPMAIGMLVTTGVVLGSDHRSPEEMVSVDINPGPPCTITINDPVLRGHLDDDPLQGFGPRADILNASLKSGLTQWRLHPENDLGGHVIAVEPVSQPN